MAALDAAATLKQKEWIRSEPREDLPRQYTNIEGRLTPHMPQSEDMKLEPSLHITPEGSLVDIPTVLEREVMETSSETAYMDFPCTQVKTRPEETKSPTTLHGTKETSQAEVLASTKQFFANIPTEDQRTQSEVYVRDNNNVLRVPTMTIAPTSTSAPTSPTMVETNLRGTESPRISLPERTMSCPTATATCRPRTWMQQLTEGQTTEPRRERDSSNESFETVEETIPGDIPDVLGCEWRVLHPFDLPGVRFPNDTTPSNQRCLAENDALVELIQMTEYLDDVPTWGHRDYRLYPLVMVTLSIEEEVEEEVEEVEEEEENGYKRGRWKDHPEILIGEMVSLMVQDLGILLLLVYPRQADKMMNGQCPLPLKEEKV